MTMADAAPARPHSRALRVGVILDSLIVPRWEHQVLELLDQSIFVDFALIVCAKDNKNASGGLFPGRLGSRLFELWKRLDQRVFRLRSMRPETFDRACFTPAHSKPRLLECHPGAAGQKVTLDAREMREIKQTRLDVLVHLSQLIPTEQFRELVRYGIWSFDEIDELFTTIFWELFHHSVVIENGINVLVNSWQGRRLHCAYCSVDDISLFRNGSNLCCKRATMLAQRLADLHRHGWPYIQDCLHSQAAEPSPAPGNLDTVRLLPKLALRAAKRKIRHHLFREQWFIAFRERSNTETNSRSAVSVLSSPSDRFYADPFIIERGGKSYLFFEDYSYERGKGAISFSEIDAAHRCSMPEVVLEEPYHLSYPCIFEWQGQVYLLPETNENKTIQLYRATQFPRGWQLEQVLVSDITMVDPTLLRHNDTFWLFAAGTEGSRHWFDGRSELFLFFSHSLSGPWIPHPRNPIVSDVRSCRPAGHIFSDNGQLIRPAQDYSVAASYAVMLNRIDVLSETDYHEVPIGIIPPGWMIGNLGTHTFNRSQRYEVLDGRTLVGPLDRHRSQPAITVVYPTRRLVEDLPHSTVREVGGLARGHLDKNHKLAAPMLNRG